MPLSFRPLDLASRSDCEHLARWANDPEIRHFATFHADAAAYSEVATPESVALRPRGPRERRWIIEADGVPVGEMGFVFGVPHMIDKDPHTAWLSIVIGEAHARGRGLGREAMLALEKMASEDGARRFELGVFEFNARALKLYQNLGYRLVSKLNDFTWWKDRKWADLRLIKEATPAPSTRS
jgi:RimJ/RimL family protein N-acetyltransferase